ncbi:MAG: hypothetical protein PHQ61_06030 [Candidatus Omnitrophica bacterium]|nr:hypothetical protein [Candidatus Omnitrophota bacterium]
MNSLTRNLSIALLISLSAHMVAFSLVDIVSPTAYEKKSPYQNIDFLGPILKKSAFDIMLENVVPSAVTAFRVNDADDASANYLRVSLKRREAVDRGTVTRMDMGIDRLAREFLDSAKLLPDMRMGTESGGSLFNKFNSDLMAMESERRVIYRPALTPLPRGQYGDKDMFITRFRVLVSPKGDVKRAEPLITSGHPQVDLLAEKYLRGLMFEPREQGYYGDEWIEEEVILSTES